MTKPKLCELIGWCIPYALDHCDGRNHKDCPVKHECKKVAKGKKDRPHKP